MTKNVDEFLEHHGVKGQKWGVRRTREKQLHLDRLQRVKNGAATSQDKALIRSRRLGMAALGTTAAITVGTIGVSVFLKHKSNLKIKEIDRNLKNLDYARRMLQAHRGVKLSQIEKAHREGKVTLEQGRRLADLLERNLNNRLGRAALENNVDPGHRFGLVNTRTTSRGAKIFRTTRELQRAFNRSRLGIPKS